MSAPATALKPVLEITEKDRARLVLYATRILRNHEDAEDVVQQAICNAWERGQYRGEAKPITYLTRCVRNQCVMFLRSEHPEGPTHRTMVRFPQSVNLSHFPRAEAYFDAHRKLETCLKVLPPKFSAVATALACGMDCIEIARYVGISHGCAKTRVFRLRTFLNLSKAMARR